MIKAALLYKDELQKKFLEHWYEPGTKYYSGTCCGIPDLVNTNMDKRQYVSIGKDGSVIGYIAHNINWCTRSAQNWGMISFDKGNLTFIRDLRTVVTNLLVKENFNRVEWWCFADNPAVRGYCNFVKRFGGKEVGHMHNSAMFSDGSLHDTLIFEILKEDVYDKVNNSPLRI